MNTYRYDEEKRKQWVKDKFTRSKTVKQICREASISRATLYNWIEEFKYLQDEVGRKHEGTVVKTSKPELLQKNAPETGERYRMLIAAIAGLDPEKTFSKKLVATLIKRFTLTVPQACAIVGIDEALYGYKPRKPEVEDYIVYEALVQLIREDRTREFETCYEILINQYPDWTRKQIKRVYRDGMVYLERKRSNTRWEKLGKAKNRDHEQGNAPVNEIPETANRVQVIGGTWNLVLLEYSSTLDNNKTDWWMLGIIDEGSGLKLNASSGFGIISVDVILAFLDKAAQENGLPKKMKIPGKTALTAREITRWVWQHKMALHTFSLNKPENAAAIRNAEQQVLATLGVETITSKTQLRESVENWITKSVEV